jgi:hypothetical protein
MLVVNAWRDVITASRTRDRAIARLSTISQEARALGLHDPQVYPAPLFTRWLRAITAATSWHRAECLAFERHSKLERVYRRTRLRRTVAS